MNLEQRGCIVRINVYRWFDDKILIYAVIEHKRGEDGKGNVQA
jgi:hypothetical protein